MSAPGPSSTRDGSSPPPTASVAIWFGQNNKTMTPLTIVTTLKTMTIVFDEDNEKDDVIHVSTKVKCTNDMVSFKKNHKPEDDDETKERLERIGLQFGTMKEVMMITMMTLMPITTSKSQKLVSPVPVKLF